MEEKKQTLIENIGLNKNLVVPIIVVVLLTILAVFLVPDDEEKDAKKPLPQLGSALRPLDSKDPAEPSQDAVPAEKGGAMSRPEMDDQATQGAMGARSMIAQLRQEQGNTGQQAFKEAEKQRSTGNTADAYLLYFFAAKQGHGEAAFILGTQSDPTYFTSVNSALDGPDQGQAIKWYKMAIDAGNKDAKQNLKELAKRIKQQAEAGSGEAKRLMLQLQ